MVPPKFIYIGQVCVEGTLLLQWFFMTVSHLVLGRGCEHAHVVAWWRTSCNCAWLIINSIRLLSPTAILFGVSGCITVWCVCVCPLWAASLDLSYRIVESFDLASICDAMHIRFCHSLCGTRFRPHTPWSNSVVTADMTWTYGSFPGTCHTL